MLAVRLINAGYEVSVIARGANLTAIQSNGIQLVETDGQTNHANVTASADFTALGTFDLVIVALKAHQISAVAADLMDLCRPDTAIVPTQNGIGWWYFQKHDPPYTDHQLKSLDPAGTLAATIPADQLIPCIAYPAAIKTAPGIITHIEGDRLGIGELDNTTTERVQSIADTFTAAGFKPRILTDLRAQVWVKALGNLAFNPISALTGTTLGEICHQPQTRALAAQLMVEALAVAEALGQNIRISIDKRIEGAAAVSDHKTSMLQDVEAGQPLEVEALVGVFVELGELVNIPTPTISTIYDLVTLLNHRLA